MASILVVCSGNICRSPVAEGLLRRGVQRRFGAEAPVVSSAGTIGLEGSAATRESVEAAGERGVDIALHIARRLTDAMVEDADLVVCMAAEHRAEIGARVPAATERTFTLKELVRLLEGDAPDAPQADDVIAARVASAAVSRRNKGPSNPFDEDIVDPLGMPLETYRAIAWELDEWTDRLVAGLYGPVPAGVPGESA
ncbi:MAG: low molecular weight phosphatase family protein [Actinomycetota bacterium]